jgi:hypothetical protein
MRRDFFTVANFHINMENFVKLIFETDLLSKIMPLIYKI